MTDRVVDARGCVIPEDSMTDLYLDKFGTRSK